MMTELIILGLVAVLAIATIAWSASDERKQARAERADLLNRLMSRDLTEYTQAQSKLSAEPLKVIPVDELIRQLDEREDADRMPV